MIITVAGLGLIGGSFCKAIKNKTEHTVLGYDINPDVVENALRDGSIDGKCDDLSVSDLTIVCLYPDATKKFITENAENFKKDSIVIDSCGIKKTVVDAVDDILRKNDVIFIGVHPMAGREFSGYDYSIPTLYDGASFIMTPSEDTPEESLRVVETLAKDIGFGKIVKTTPENHDSVIAYTSQLAHIVSSAYIKSPTLRNECGFSAGSFKDLTRVAKLNEDMWTGLFLQNKEPLLFEIRTIIEKLEEYYKALDENDSDVLRELLREGRILKEESLAKNKEGR